MVVWMCVCVYGCMDVWMYGCGCGCYVMLCYVFFFEFYVVLGGGLGVLQVHTSPLVPIIIISIFYPPSSLLDISSSLPASKFGTNTINSHQHSSLHRHCQTLHSNLEH